MGVHRRPYRRYFFFSRKSNQKELCTVTSCVLSFGLLLGNESFYYLTVPLLLKELGKEDL